MTALPGRSCCGDLTLGAGHAAQPTAGGPGSLWRALGLANAGLTEGVHVGAGAPPLAEPAPWAPKDQAWSHTPPAPRDLSSLSKGPRFHFALRPANQGAGPAFGQRTAGWGTKWRGHPACTCPLPPGPGKAPKLPVMLRPTSLPARDSHTLTRCPQGTRELGACALRTPAGTVARGRTGSGPGTIEGTREAASSCPGPGVPLQPRPGWSAPYVQVWGPFPPPCTGAQAPWCLGTGPPLLRAC